MEPFIIEGVANGVRVESRVLEEKIQNVISQGMTELVVRARGQHGIGGRLWKAGDKKIRVTIEGPPGQRVGSMGFANTSIEILGPCSDDVGWLNAGAEIIVHGNAGNGAANAMAQGKIFVGGSTGARAMTMTKANPRFDPPELWVLGSVGDYFGEFMAGGVAVVCGFEPKDERSVLGYRPCVGMVRGTVYFRGPITGYSQADAKLTPLTDENWVWLEQNIRVFLEKINRPELREELSNREDWQCIQARKPHEKASTPRKSMKDFYANVWESEVGAGGIIGDIIQADHEAIPLIATGKWRRFVPTWENEKYAPPCEGSCPTGIPVQERWSLIRAGKVDEAVDLALAYTPFPATVCGYLCPNLCMEGCSRNALSMAPVDVRQLGKASMDAKMPELPELSGKKVAVIGGGPAGLSVAWQLRRAGHQAVIYDTEKTLGGKIASVIPHTRIPAEVMDAELERMGRALEHKGLAKKLDKKGFAKLRAENEFVVVAAGASKPRALDVPGKERLQLALDFLKAAKAGKAKVGKKVVVIGAGNVGCDVATEAARLGAEDVTLIDVQKPASFGEERKAAEAAGARFLWPRFTKEITKKGVVLADGSMLEADTVVVSIGDEPDLDFLPEEVETERGFVKVDEFFRTTDPQVFAIGDAVQPGLLTDAIGAGRKAAQAMVDLLDGNPPHWDAQEMFDMQRVKLEYFDPRKDSFDGIDDCAGQCSSCGACRDCGLCAAVCPTGAITRNALENDSFEMAVDAEKCIGCGFCAGCCPCGIWRLVENEPM